MKPGPTNTITDVPGLLVGNAQDEDLKSGVTVLAGHAPFTAAVHIMGGAPGSRETDLLAPDKLVQEVDALVLSGGSAFGLEAAGGVMAGLRNAGRGFAVGDQKVPIVPGAILFDLLNGGNKNWIGNPYAALGRAAYDDLSTDCPIGSIGAGTGATTATLKGGLGSASARLENGITIGALVAVNALGKVTMNDGPQFWAAPWELNQEFGGLGIGTPADPGHEPWLSPVQGSATTIAIVATDAALDQAQAQRLAVAAHDGMARAIVPSHTPYDGDLVFAAATGAQRLPNPDNDILTLGHAAACCLARAIARGVYAARPSKGDRLATWHMKFGDPQR